MTFRLVILGAPRTKKTHNRLGWRYSRRLGKKIRVILPSAAWVRWTKSAQIVVLEDGCQLNATVLHAGRGKLRADRIFLPGRFFLGLAPLTGAKVRCKALFYRDANTGDAVGFYQGLADLLEKRAVVANDRQIVDWAGSELRKDTSCPRVELTLEILE